MYRRVAFTFSASLLEVMREACVAAGLPKLSVHFYSENINGCGWPTRRLLRALTAASGRADLARITVVDATDLKSDPFRVARARFRLLVHKPNDDQSVLDLTELQD